jgi:hypothetical protein
VKGHGIIEFMEERFKSDWMRHEPPSLPIALLQFVKCWVYYGEHRSRLALFVQIKQYLLDVRIGDVVTREDYGAFAPPVLKVIEQRSVSMNLKHLVELVKV